MGVYIFNAYDSIKLMKQITFKKERNKLLVYLRDKKGWTFEKLAQHFNISRMRVWKVYEKMKGNPDWKICRKCKIE